MSCGFDPRLWYVANLSDSDKVLLIIVSVLALLVVGVATLLDLFLIISFETARLMDLMAVSWWFGAIMTFVFQKIKRSNAPLTQR